MRSWGETSNSLTKPRTLGIYIDLSKCQYLDAKAENNFEQLEHAFVSEVCEAIKDQMVRLWPELSKEPGMFAKLFQSAESKDIQETRLLLARFAEILMNGVPRLVDKSEPVKLKESRKTNTSQSAGIKGELKVPDPNLQANLSSTQESADAYEQETSIKTTYRLMIADILRILADLKDTAKLSAIFLFIDEYSALSETLQRRFTTLLRKVLGTHAGVFIKLCAITDNYTLGSSIILQRDLFEISLDLDAYVERSSTLSVAMEGLREQAKAIVTSRLKAYECPTPTELFDLQEDWVWTSLSRSAMGIPRTLGIVLQQAWYKALSSKSSHIRKRDISYGIQHASKAQVDQMLGAAKDSIAIPAIVVDIWNTLLRRAQTERTKSSGTEASHFMLKPEHEHMLKYLNMFFLVHLLTTGKTTKTDRTSRSLYCFDYGVCEENRLGFSTDGAIFRRDRFAYDDALSPFENYFRPTGERTYRCTNPSCNRTFKESELSVAGFFLSFCPIDKHDLVLDVFPTTTQNFTEEETRIIGAIRSAQKNDRKYARQIADDVGCYVQKVASFGKKLEKMKLAHREKEPLEDKYIYFE